MKNNSINRSPRIETSPPVMTQSETPPSPIMAALDEQAIQVNDLVLVYQGSLLYESRVKKIYDPETRMVSMLEPRTKKVKQFARPKHFPAKYKSELAYYIHYQGWNDKWNEWVSLDRILPKTPSNVELQKTLQKRVRAKESQTAEKPKFVIHLKTSPKTNVKAERKSSTVKPRNKVSTAKKERHYHHHIKSSKSYELFITMPVEIKKILIRDWQNITKHEKLVELPSKYPISKLLKKFVRDICRNKDTDGSLLENYIELARSLEDYFNRSLGTLLLYRYEREQYIDILKRTPVPKMIDVYSPIFFLRLCSILPNILIDSVVDLQTLEIVKGFLTKFYIWFDAHKDVLLKDDYENCMPLVPFMQ